MRQQCILGLGALFFAMALQACNANNSSERSADTPLAPAAKTEVLPPHEEDLVAAQAPLADHDFPRTAQSEQSEQSGQTEQKAPTTELGSEFLDSFHHQVMNDTAKPELVWRYLRHQGMWWDDGLDDGPVSANAIPNLLQQFRAADKYPFSFHDQPEVIRIAKLPTASAADTMPLLFMTGRGLSLSDDDIQILRAYVQGGGMLFVDAGSPSFDSDFRKAMTDVFPQAALEPIPHDDVIFRHPYRLAHGVDPMSAHGGTKAMGIRISNRWGVFYHPGDVKGAFRDRATLRNEIIRRNAFKIIVNIVSYSQNTGQSSMADQP